MACALLLAAAWKPSMAAGQPGGRGDGQSAAEADQMVEAEPIRCWWRASKGAVAIGESFEVRLTCAVLETDSVQVVPDESRLAVAGVQLKPFDLVGGEHPADTRAGGRRFFQYLYRVRLFDADTIGTDVTLPNLAITYNIQSQVSEGSRLAGRDFTYVMPGIPVHILSLVPDTGVDIRDGADVGLERVDSLRFRARVLDIGSLALFATGTLLGVLALVAIAGRARPALSRPRPRLSDARILGAASAELSRLARETITGWTPELVGAGHAALRVVSAVAIERPVSERPMAPGRPSQEGLIVVPGRFPRRHGAAVTSPTTTVDLDRAMAELPPSTAPDRRAGLEALRTAVAAFTAARFDQGGLGPDEASLAEALEGGRKEAQRLARERRWRLFPKWDGVTSWSSGRASS